VELFRKCPAKPLTGQECGFLGRQGQVADDYADSSAVYGRGDSVIEGPITRMEKEVEEGVETRQQLWINI
jgi:hypothetical protein